MKKFVKPFIFVSSACAATLAAPALALATDTGASASGAWDNASTWTSGTVPTSSDNVYIGSVYPVPPGGAANSATVTVSADESANNVNVGYGSPTNGTLLLNGGTLTITGGLNIGQYGGAGSVGENGGSFTAGNVLVYNSNSLTLGTADVTSTIDIESNSALTTAASGNITGGGSIANGASLNLGANMSLSGGLNVEGTGATLNLGGYNLSANTLYLGYYLSSAVTLNRGSGTPGTLTLNTLGLGNGQNLALIAGDTITNIDIENGATLTTAASGNITSGGSVASATLTLGADANMISTGGLNVEGSGATLNLAGFNLTIGTLALGYYSTSAVTLNRGSGTAGTLSLESLDLANGQNVTLVAGDTITGGGIDGVGGTGAVNLYGGATLSTVSATNVTCTVNVVASTLNLGANMSIGNQTVNTENGGVVNLNGHNLTASYLLLGYDGTSAVTLNRGSGTPGNLTLGSLYLGNGQNLTLIAGDTISGGDNGVNVTTGATLTMAAATNISNNAVNVQDSGSTFNAQGYALTATKLFFGFNGTAPVTVSNLGAVTASELHVGNGTALTLHGGDVISSVIDLEGGSVLTVQQASDATGLTLNGTSLSDLTIDPSSMDLDFTSSASDGWDFRWEDPNGSNWISTITGMIGDGQINLSLLPGQSYEVVDSGGYTYVTVPEPSSLMLMGLGLVGLGAVRVRRRRVTAGSRPA